MLHAPGRKPMLLNRRTLILAGLAAAAVSGCSAEPKVETLTGNSAYVAQNPKHPLAGVAASATVPVAPEGEVLTTDAVAYIVSAIEAVVATLRDVHDTIDGEDPSSSGIIEDLTVQLEQQAWFLSAEIRKPVR